MADGSLKFDTRVDTSGFNKGTSNIKKQVNSVQDIFKKMSVTIAAAFSVTKLVQFGKEAVNLASDLQEVQNVVDTAFGSMAYKMEEFADTCIETYGMSKLTAKEMGSTFMAMAKGMGQATDVASDKAVELTGRLGDIMSFYNKTASEVNTIGKAIYSGETEPLKSIGVIMTETNLKTYTLSKGYKKLYTEMTAAEKLMVRQEYFLEQTSMAAGDFVKTQDSWANQTRILSERWKEFMTICGNGLIQVLTPTVKMLNNMLDSLIDIGEELSAVFGISVSSNISKEAAAAQKEIAGMGESLDEIAEQAEGSAASFDELEIIGGVGNQNGETDRGNVTANLKQEALVTQESEKATGALEQSLRSLGETLGWLGTMFQTSFMTSFGNVGVFEEIIQSVQGIRESLLDMLSTTGVQEAAAGFVEAYVSYIGSSFGAFASVGSSIASNLIGGIRLSLSENRESIQNSIIALFNIGERMEEVQAGFINAISGILTAFQSDEAKQLTADIITLFTNAIFGITELLGLFAVDVVGMITAPFVENEELIRTTIEETFAAVEPILTTLQGIINNIFDTIRSVYDEKIAPMITSFREGFVEIGEKLLNVYNEYILPVVNYASSLFENFASGPLSGLIHKFGEFAGKVAECITAIWKNFLQPFIVWFIENIVPVIQPALETVIDVFFTLWDGVSSVIGFILDALGGVLDFITGIFTGDWKKAWDGVKDIFSGKWNAIATILKTVIDVIHTTITGKLEVIANAWEKAWGTVKNVFNTAWNSIKEKMSTMKSAISGIMNGLKDEIVTVITTIKSKFITVFTSVKNRVINIFNGMWNAIRKVINSILGGIEGMANGVIRGINTVIRALNNLSFDIPDWVPAMGGKKFGFNLTSLNEVSIPKLATGTVVPANFGEFAAILGDNKREAEVVSPISAMKQAFKEAITEMGGIGGGEYTFIAQLDGNEIYRETVRQDRMYRKQTGKSGFSTGGAYGI